MSPTVPVEPGSPTPSPLPELPTLLLFDAEAGGHHPEYVRHVVDALAAAGEPYTVVLAVPQEMLDAHPELTAHGARLAPLCAPASSEGPWAASRSRWVQLEAAVREHRPTDVLLLYADSLLPTLSRHTRLPGTPRLVTIHFRPPVHQPGIGVRDRLRDVVKRRHLRRTLRHPEMRVALSLDPRPVTALRAQAGGTAVLPLADPVPAPVLTPAERDEANRQFRDQFGLGSEHHLMVLFGALERRKGIFQTLDAVLRLPKASAARLAVAFVGPVHPEDTAAFAEAVAATKSVTAARIVVQDGFVKSERAIESVLSAADTVLLPYQRHIGSSAVLIRAAALARPVISQDVGLVGEWTRAHHLGRAVDSTDPAALARAMQDAIDDPRGAFDPAEATAFASAHTPQAFVATLLDGIRQAMRRQ